MMIGTKELVLKNVLTSAKISQWQLVTLSELQAAHILLYSITDLKEQYVALVNQIAS